MGFRTKLRALKSWLSGQREIAESKPKADEPKPTGYVHEDGGWLNYANDGGDGPMRDDRSIGPKGLPPTGTSRSSPPVGGVDDFGLSP